MKDEDSANSPSTGNLIRMPTKHRHVWRITFPLVPEEELVKLGFRLPDDKLRRFVNDAWVRDRNGESTYLWSCLECGEIRGNLTIDAGCVGVPFVMNCDTELGQRLGDVVAIGILCVRDNHVMLDPIVRVSHRLLVGAARDCLLAHQQTSTAKSRSWKFGNDGRMVVASRVVETGPQMLVLTTTSARKREHRCDVCHVRIMPGTKHWRNTTSEYHFCCGCVFKKEE